MSKLTTINAERFRNLVFFSLTLRRQFGNRAKVKDGKKLTEYLALKDEARRAGTEAAPITMGTVEMNGACKATKTLIQSPAYDALNEFMNATKERLVGRFGMAMQSHIKEGLFTVALPQVEEFDRILTEANNKLQTELVPAFLADYPQAIGRAETTPVKDGGLGPLFNRADYPNVDDLADAFALEWGWLAFSVPEGLPEGLRQRAHEQLQQQLSEAADEIQQALRTSFRELIAHATEKLTPGDDGKNKVFRDSLIENLHAFLESFNARNVMNDTELALLVEQARGILTNDGAGSVTPKALRQFNTVRDTVRSQFEAIQSQLDGMIEVQSSRRFDFDDEAQPAAAAAN